MWWLADVKSTDGGQYTVLYSDNEEGRVSLTSATRWNVSLDQAAPRWSWLLLCEAPISNYADLEHIHELRAKGRGRKRTVRKGPAAGGVVDDVMRCLFCVLTIEIFFMCHAAVDDEDASRLAEDVAAVLQKHLPEKERRLDKAVGKFLEGRTCGRVTHDASSADWRARRFDNT